MSDFYRTILFQFVVGRGNSGEDSDEDSGIDTVLGTFTYDYIKYSYYVYCKEKEEKEESKKRSEKKKKVYNKYMNKYIKTFFEERYKGLKNKKNLPYKIQCISDFNQNNNNSDIEFDQTIDITCIWDQKNKIHSFTRQLDNFYKARKTNEAEFLEIENSVYSLLGIRHDIVGLNPYEGIHQLFLKNVEVESNEEEVENKREEDKEVKKCKKTTVLTISETPYTETTEKSEAIKYSKEFRKICYEDARERESFWCYMLSKPYVKNNKELRNYCRNQQATQYVRKFTYDKDHLFRLCHLFVVKEINMDETINTDFDNNDEIEESITFELESTCGKYKSIGTISRSGSYDNGGFTTDTNIDYIDGIEKKLLKELYVNLFRKYCILDTW